jgi:hypothetical protein
MRAGANTAAKPAGKAASGSSSASASAQAGLVLASGHLQAVIRPTATASGLVSLLRTREVRVPRLDGGSRLVEVLVRGEPGRSQVRGQVKLLLRINQICVGQVDIAPERIDLFLAGRHRRDRARRTPARAGPAPARAPLRARGSIARRACRPCARSAPGNREAQEAAADFGGDLYLGRLDNAGGRCAVTPRLRIRNARMPTAAARTATAAIVWIRWAGLDSIGSFDRPSTRAAAARGTKGKANPT